MKLRVARPARSFRLPVEAVKTYQVLQPLNSHWVPATCEDVECPDYMYGWRVHVEKLSEAQLNVVIHCGRKYTRVSLSEGFTYLLFEAGQECFKAHEHMKPNGRQGLYVVRDGDPWRGNPRGTGKRVHTRPEFWVEDFGCHQQKLYERWKRG